RPSAASSTWPGIARLASSGFGRIEYAEPVLAANFGAVDRGGDLLQRTPAGPAGWGRRWADTVEKVPKCLLAILFLSREYVFCRLQFRRRRCSTRIVRGFGRRLR